MRQRRIIDVLRAGVCENDFHVAREHPTPNVQRPTSKSESELDIGRSALSVRRFLLSQDLRSIAERDVHVARGLHQLAVRRHEF